jgi:uncharacterized membrane protein
MVSNLILGISLVLFSTLIGSFGALFFKKASKRIKKNIFSVLKTYHIYLGVFFYGISTPIFVFALKFGDLSTLYPVSGFSYIWVSLLSTKFSGEKMNDLKWFGIFMILVGIFLIGYGG